MNALLHEPMAKRVLGRDRQLLVDVAKAVALRQNDLTVFDDRDRQPGYFPGMDRLVHERVKSDQRLLGGRERVIVGKDGAGDETEV